MRTKEQIELMKQMESWIYSTTPRTITMLTNWEEHVLGDISSIIYDKHENDPSSDERYEDERQLRREFNMLFKALCKIKCPTANVIKIKHKGAQKGDYIEKDYLIYV